MARARAAGREKADREAGVTLKQVAAAARVSEMTVSRVMRNVDAVSEKTRTKVLDAAAHLGYLPNRVAGALASRSTNLLGIVVPSLTNHVYPEVLAGIVDVLADARLQPVFGITDYDPAREEQLVHDMLSWRPAGLAVCGFNQTQRTHELLEAARIPRAQMMDVDGEPFEYNVGISHRAAGEAMGIHLLERGYRKVGYVGSNLERDTAAAKRLASLERTLRAAGYPLAAKVVVPEPSSIQLGRRLTARLLAAGEAVDAVHFANDNMAAGGVMHCLANGIDMPGSLALSGFAGLDIADAMPVSLTTIRSPRREIGQRTARYVLEHLESPGAGRITREVLSFQLCHGEST